MVEEKQIQFILWGCGCLLTSHFYFFKMKITHEQLKESGRKILLRKGFKESEIFEEYPINVKSKNRKRYVIDIAGVKKDFKVAIECGSLSKNKNELKKLFDEVIILPYVRKTGEMFYCSNCEHSWFPRVEKPKQCPKCKRYFELEEEIKKEEVKK